MWPSVIKVWKTRSASDLTDQISISPHQLPLQLIKNKSYLHCQPLPTLTVLPPYSLYSSYQGGPVGLHVLYISQQLGFQQISLPWLSDLTVGVGLSSYLQSFTHQLHGADWFAIACCGPRGFFQANNALT